MGKGSIRAGRFEHIDCTHPQQILEAVRRHDIGTIFHLAALLSAVAEERPQIAWSINMGGRYNALGAARQYARAVFFPSSIGAFGPPTDAARMHTADPNPAPNDDVRRH